MGEGFDVPKPMASVAGKVLLLRHVEMLARFGITDISLIVGFKADVIKGFFGNGGDFGVRIDYISEDEPLGTGGGLSLLPREDTVVLLGDVFMDVSLDRFICFHKEKGASITLFVHPNSHPYDSDIVVNDRECRVVAFKSKRDSDRGCLRNLVNAGLYVFDKGALPLGEAVRRDLEREVIVPLIAGGGVFAYRQSEYIKDIGTPERLRAVERDVLSGAAAARNLTNRQRAVFLDRDGTINEENGFVTAPDGLRLIPGAAEAVKLLNKSPYLVICVTNQPVIARGDVSLEGLEVIHAKMDGLLGEHGAYLDDLFFCPHHPDKGFEGEILEYKVDCECRKPKAGMLFEAADRYNIDLSLSYMVGDRTSDIAAGKAAGCVTVAVKTGMGMSDGKIEVEADKVCGDVSDAVRWILERDNV
jgi:D,D-heptose 1,7-bisphosphate phosphatase